jgi:hypothetical protein
MTTLLERDDNIIYPLGTTDRKGPDGEKSQSLPQTQLNYNLTQSHYIWH